MRPPRELLGIAAVLGTAALVATCDGKPPPEEEHAPLEPFAPPAHPDDPPGAQRQVLDELLLARNAPRHPGDGGGRAWLEPGSSTAVAGETGRWTIGYEAGELGIEVGGFVRLTVPRFWEWTAAQTEDPEAPGYTMISTEAEGLEFEPREAPGFFVDFLVRGRRMEPGEKALIAYGAGPAEARADSYAERDSRFWISVDADGDDNARVLPDSPGVDVAPGPPARLSAVLPSTAAPDETVLLRLAFLDQRGSRGAAFEGTVTLVAAPEGLEMPAEVVFGAADAGVRAVEVRTRERGVFRVLAHAADGSGEFLVATNPLIVEGSVARIRWADLHGHSNLSDGTGTPEEFLGYARDVAGLDAVCLTDHDHWGMLALDEYPDLWKRIREATESFHEPGRFVTLLGYEWTNWIHGHRHVLYFGNEGEVLSSVDERYQTPAQLWEGLAGTGALTFAHHSAGGPVPTNWDYAPPPEIEPVTEVASVHGSSESPDAPQRIYSPRPGNFVRDALKRGYRLGFVGSGDSHDGHPGLAHLVNPYMGGLAAVLTEDLSREGLRKALLERRCYATNGPRIVLRTALDGQRMGSTVKPRDDQALLYVRAIACAPIATIELIRSGDIVDTVEDGEHWDVEAAFHPTALTSGEYLYVRVVQVDGGAAWSSPFFVE